MEAKISKAQLEVWEWKQKAYEEIKDMPLKDALRFIREQAKDLVDEIKERKKQKLTQPQETATLKNVDYSTGISQAQLEVWEWKEKAYDSVKHLPDIMSQLALIHERTKDSVARINKAYKKNTVVKKGLSDKPS